VCSLCGVFWDVLHHEICAVLGYYGAHCGKSLPTFRDVSVFSLFSSSDSCLTPLRCLSTLLLFLSCSTFPGPIGCREMSVRNYHYTLRNNPEERRSHLLRGGSLKSHLLCHVPEALLFTVTTARAPSINHIMRKAIVDRYSDTGEGNN
jgi:hypothetical protein